MMFARKPKPQPETDAVPLKEVEMVRLTKLDILTHPEISGVAFDLLWLIVKDRPAGFSFSHRAYSSVPPGAALEATIEDGEFVIRGKQVTV